MIHIVAKPFDTDNNRLHRLPFYLAVEEWVARHLPAADYFFTWKVNPTVIIGRNQRADKEVDLDFCRNAGIELYRRRSGGGCVFADLNNLMISYVTPSTEVTTTFAAYTGMVAEMLCDLGLDAQANGRNDVLVDGAKVSGNAFYHLPGRSIVHGTMLYDFDIDTMSHAITPSRSKLESNGVKSINSRITSVSKHRPDISLDELERFIIQRLSDGEYVLTDRDLSQVKEIEQRYYDLKWTFGRRGVLGSPKDQRRAVRRIPGVGEINVLISLSDGKIDDVEMTGDFFMLSDLDAMLFDKIKGLEPSHSALSHALMGTDVTKVIAGLSTDDFINLISNT